MVNSDFLNGLTRGGRQEEHHRMAGRKRAWARPRSTTSCATGSSAASATGASPSPWCTATSAAGVPVPGGSAAPAAARCGELRAHRQRREPPVHDDRLGQHHLPPLRRPRQAGDRHHAPVGRFQLVLPALLRPPQRQGIGQQGSTGLLVMPVDWYNGGMEHTTLHLLYSRFWHQFLYDHRGWSPHRSPTRSAPATA